MKSCAEVEQAVPVFQESFCDLEMMVSSHPVLDFSYLQIGRGTFEGEMLGFPTPHGMFWSSRSNLSVEGTCSIPRGFLLAAVTPSGHDFWHDCIVKPESLALGTHSTGLEHRTEDDHEAWVWLIRIQRYLEVAEALGIECPDLERTEPVLSTCLGQIQRMKAGIREFLAVATRSPELTSTQTRWFENMLVEGTLRCLSDQEVHKSDSISTNEGIALAVKQYMQRHADSPLCVTSLCEQLKISERTLRDHFIRFFDISPAAYHLALRLNRVHSRLSSAEQVKGAVALAATKSGFWHMGRFSGQYKRHFGESPTTTLARKSSLPSRVWRVLPRKGKAPAFFVEGEGSF